MQTYSDFFAFLAACAAEPNTSSDGAAGSAAPDGIEVRETEISDSDFHLLGRALTFRRYAMEMRGQARLMLDCASDYERQVSASLAQLRRSLAAKGRP